MVSLVAAIATLAIVLLGLAVMVGKVTAGDALVRLGIFILLICFAPAVAGIVKASAPLIIKPALLLLVLVAVVTVSWIVLRTLFQ